MNLRKVLVPLGGLVLLGVAYRGYGWPGVALAGGAIVMFLLLHFNRVMQALKRAADRPIGYVAERGDAQRQAQAGRDAAARGGDDALARRAALAEGRSSPRPIRWTRWRRLVCRCASSSTASLREWTLVRPEVGATPPRRGVIAAAV